MAAIHHPGDPLSGSRTGFCVRFLSVLFFLVGAALVPPAQALVDTAERWNPGRVLVQPKPGVAESSFHNLVGVAGGVQVGRIAAINVREISVPPQAVEAVARALARNPSIKFAEPDYRMELAYTVPNDPQYGDAWHLPKIDAPPAWTLSRADGVIVAVLDTGIDADHPEFLGKLVPGWNSVSQNDDISDIHGHGTLVSGTIGAATDNGIGIAAVGWNAMIMPVRVSDRTDGAAYTSDMARGLTWAADQGAHIANMSYMSWRHLTVQNAAQYMRSLGGLVFGAAGNNGTDAGFAPTPHVVVVASTTSNDDRSGFSNFGSYVDLAAPGSGILTTARGGGYGTVSGTSFAAPIAAATGALIRAANDQLTPDQIEQVLFDSAVDLGDEGWDPYFGWGRVDAGAATVLAWSVGVDREPPEVAILEPAANAVVHGEVRVVVAASDNEEVARVDLHADGRLIGSETVAPYEFLWDSTTVSDGTVRLIAEARDAAGNVSSHAVDVTVRQPVVEEPEPPPPGDEEAPVVAITSPADGSQVHVNVRLAATATDNVGVTRIELSVNGNLMCSSGNASVRCNWNTRWVPDGAYAISAHAMDAAGNIGSTSITVYKGTPPSDDEGGGNGDADSKGGPPPGRGPAR